MVRHGIFLGLWIVLFGAEFLYRVPLREKSMELQKKLKPYATNAGNVIFEIFSQYGFGPAYFLGFAIMLNWFERGRAFYYCVFLSVCGYAVNITKMAYSEPRPYMLDPPPAINVYGCSAEYGNPSGHALWAASFHFFVFLDLCHASKGPHRSKVFYWVTLFFAIFFCFIIGFARFYEGVHSINQIVYGWTIGFWIAFYMHFCFRDLIIDHVEELLLCSDKGNHTK